MKRAEVNLTFQLKKRFSSSVLSSFESPSQFRNCIYSNPSLLQNLRADDFHELWRDPIKIVTAQHLRDLIPPTHSFQSYCSPEQLKQCDEQLIVHLNREQLDEEAMNEKDLLFYFDHRREFLDSHSCYTLFEYAIKRSFRGLYEEIYYTVGSHIASKWMTVAHLISRFHGIQQTMDLLQFFIKNNEVTNAGAALILLKSLKEPISCTPQVVDFIIKHLSTEDYINLNQRGLFQVFQLRVLDKISEEEKIAFHWRLDWNLVQQKRFDILFRGGMWNIIEQNCSTDYQYFIIETLKLLSVKDLYEIERDWFGEGNSCNVISAINDIAEEHFEDFEEEELEVEQDRMNCITTMIEEYKSLTKIVDDFGVNGDGKGLLDASCLRTFGKYLQFQEALKINNIMINDGSGVDLEALDRAYDLLLDEQGDLLEQWNTRVQNFGKLTYNGGPF